MKFIFDNNLSIDLAKAIGELSRQECVVERVHHLKDLFPQGANDVVWLNRLQDHGANWVVVTNDKLKKQGGDERATFHRNELIGYVLDPQWNGQASGPSRNDSANGGRSSWST